jgi:hypothetical protein
MANELTLNLSLLYSKNKATIACVTKAFQVSVAGNNALKNMILVGMTDATLDLGAIATIGQIWLHNLATAGNPPSPVLAAITNTGTPGTSIWSYVVIANYADGSKSLASSVATTATGNATLTGTNYNVLSWADTGATSYDVYRTASGGTPSTLGKITTTASLTYNDQGAAGDGSAVPLIGIPSNYPIEFGPTNISYPNWLWAGEIALLRWNAAAIHRKATVLPALLEYALIEQ